MAENKPTEQETVELEIPIPGEEEVKDEDAARKEEKCEHPHHVDPLEIREQLLVDTMIQDQREANIYVNQARYSFLKSIEALNAALLKKIIDDSSK